MISSARARSPGSRAPGDRHRGRAGPSAAGTPALAPDLRPWPDHTSCSLAHPDGVRRWSGVDGRASGLTGIVAVVPVSPRVLAGPDEIGAEDAALVVDRYRRRTPGRQFLLGCPGGRSLASTYAHLAGLTAGELDLSDLVVVMMDEYVEATDGGFRAVDPTLPHSCHRFGRVEIVAPLNAGRSVRSASPGRAGGRLTCGARPTRSTTAAAAAGPGRRLRRLIGLPDPTRFARNAVVDGPSFPAHGEVDLMGATTHPREEPCRPPSLASTAAPSRSTTSGITELRGSFRGEVVVPGDAGYDEARAGGFNELYADRRPGLIVRCTGTADVDRRGRPRGSRSPAGRGARRGPQHRRPLEHRRRAADRSRRDERRVGRPGSPDGHGPGRRHLGRRRPGGAGVRPRRPRRHHLHDRHRRHHPGRRHRLAAPQARPGLRQPALGPARHRRRPADPDQR